MGKINGGYVLQPRKFDESEISKAPPHVREIWLYFVRNANHADKNISGTIIKRGQLVTSYSQIINELSWFVGYRKESYKKHHCETATKLLVKASMITTARTTRGIVVTICNYDYYQNPKNYETDDEADNGTCYELAMKPHDKQECKNERMKGKEYASTLLSQIDSQFKNLNPEYIQIAKAFQSLFRTNLHNANTSTKIADSMTGKSIDDIRLIIEADGYKVEDLQAAFKVVRDNDFWKKNILSTKSLRKHIAKLKFEKNGADKKPSHKGGNRDFEELDRIINAVTEQ